MSRFGIGLLALLLLALTGGVAHAQEETPPDEYRLVFGVNAGDENTLEVQVYNLTADEAAFSVEVESVFVEHAHFAQVVNGSLYLLRRSGDTAGDAWEDQLWRYTAESPQGEMLFAAQGLDFRVAPDESSIAVLYPLPPDGFFSGLGFLSLDGVLTDEYAFEWVDERLSLSLGEWASDSSSFWALFLDGPAPALLSQVDRASGEVTEYDLSGLPLYTGAEFALNPDSGLLAYSDYPAFFELGAQQTFEQGGEAVNLYLRDLESGEERVLATSAARPFAPRWMDETRLEFFAPDETGVRVVYDLVAEAYLEGVEANAETVALQMIPPGFDAILPQVQASGVPLLLPPEFPVEAGLSAVTPYVLGVGQGFYELSLDYGADCRGAGACHYGRLMGRRTYAATPQGTENFPFDPAAAQWVILSRGVQGYYLAFQCGANCSDAQIFWLLNDYEYMLGVRGGTQEDVVALANALLANLQP